MSVKLSIGTWAYTFDDNSKQLFSIEDLAGRLGKLGFDGVALSDHINTVKKAIEFKKPDYLPMETRRVSG